VLREFEFDYDLRRYRQHHVFLSEWWDALGRDVLREFDIVLRGYRQHHVLLSEWGDALGLQLHHQRHDLSRHRDDHVFLSEWWNPLGSDVHYWRHDLSSNAHNNLHLLIGHALGLILCDRRFDIIRYGQHRLRLCNWSDPFGLQLRDWRHYYASDTHDHLLVRYGRPRRFAVHYRCVQYLRGGAKWHGHPDPDVRE
jgi:hypothetical protein